MIYSRNYRATNDAAILVHSLPNLQDYNHAIFLFLFSQQPSLSFYCPIRAADQSIIRFNKKQKKNNNFHIGHTSGTMLSLLVSSIMHLRNLSMMDNLSQFPGTRLEKRRISFMKRIHSLSVWLIWMYRWLSKTLLVFSCRYLYFTM